MSMIRRSAFQADLAQKLPSRRAAFQATTPVAVVTAFRTVGSILVIALLVGPAAAGRLMSEKLSRVFFWSLAFALAAVTLGIAMAKSLPGVIFPRLGYERVTDAGAAGLIAVACGIVFVCAMIIAPRDGAIIKLRDWFVLQVRIAAEDILGLMYRSDERKEAFVRGDMELVQPAWWRWIAERDLSRRGLISESGGRYTLTETGRKAAGLLVRAHRLWESYMAKHFELSPEHLHETAHSVEHFIDAEIRAELTEELDQPDADPHGRSIPPAS